MITRKVFTKLVETVTQWECRPVKAVLQQKALKLSCTQPDGTVPQPEQERRNFMLNRIKAFISDLFSNKVMETRVTEGGTEHSQKALELMVQETSAEQFEGAVELPACEPVVELPAQAQVSPEEKENNEMSETTTVQQPQDEAAILTAEEDQMAMTTITTTPTNEAATAAKEETMPKPKVQAKTTEKVKKEDQMIENTILSRQFRYDLWLASQSLETRNLRGRMTGKPREAAVRAYDKFLLQALAAYPTMGIVALQAVLPFVRDGLSAGSRVAQKVRHTYLATGRLWAKEFFAMDAAWLHGTPVERASALDAGLVLRRGRLDNDVEAREAAKAARRAARREARRALGLTKVLKLTPEQRMQEWAPKNGAATLSVQTKAPKGLPVKVVDIVAVAKLSPEEKLAKRLEILALRKERAAAKKAAKAAVVAPRLSKAGIPQSKAPVNHSMAAGRRAMNGVYKQNPLQRKAANMGFGSTWEYIEYTQAVRGFKQELKIEKAKRAEERKARAEVRAKRAAHAEKQKMYFALSKLKSAVTKALRAVSAAAMLVAEKLVLESLAALRGMGAEPSGQTAADLAALGFVVA